MPVETVEVWRRYQRIIRRERLRQALNREFYRRGWPRLTERYAQPEGPREGETKPGKHGPLVFRDGRWRRLQSEEEAGKKTGGPRQGPAHPPGRITRQSSRTVTAEQFMQLRTETDGRRRGLVPGVGRRHGGVHPARGGTEKPVFPAPAHRSGQGHDRGCNCQRCPKTGLHRR